MEVTTTKRTTLRFPSVKKLMVFMKAVCLMSWELSTENLKVTSNFTAEEVLTGLHCGASVEEENNQISDTF